MWFKNGLKAQKLLAQGIALGIEAINKSPCKGKSFINYLIFESFCPYRAPCLHPYLPRVLPWARSFCPFRAYGVNMLRFSYNWSRSWRVKVIKGHYHFQPPKNPVISGHGHFPVIIISESLKPVIKVKVIKDFGIIQMFLKATKKSQSRNKASTGILILNLSHYFSHLRKMITSNHGW